MLEIENIIIFQNMEDCVKYFEKTIKGLNVNIKFKRLYEYNIVSFLDVIKNRNNKIDTILKTICILNYDCLYIISLLKFHHFKVVKVYLDEFYNVLGYCHN